MSDVNMFEMASRMKVRFTGSFKGMATVDDLWDLPLETLNAMAQGLHKTIKETGEVDFLNNKPNKTDAETQLKFDLVVYVIKTRQAEQEAKDAKRKDLAAARAEKEVLMNALVNKRNAAIDTLSEEEILKKLEALPV